MAEIGNKGLHFLAGGGEMGELIRSIDWSETPLGDAEKWPPSLKQTVSMMLTTTFPVLVCWGANYIQLYNDAFRPINGISKHPQALGGPAKETYAEIWETIGPMFQNVMNGEALGFPDFMVPMDRNGFVENCYFNFSYSPIRDESGKVNGVLVICVETTDKIHAIEQFQTLSEELAAANEEYAVTNEELAAVNEELAASIDELTITQNNLQRSEKLFKSIALNIPKSLIIMIDRNHRFIAVEGDLMEKLGYDSRDYTGKHPTEVAPPERYEATKHLYDRVLSGEKFSAERQAATGENFMVHFVPLKNYKDEVEAGLMIALDITDIKQAEERSAKLAAIVETSDDAIISKTMDSVITSWNASAERMFGFKAEEIIGKTIYELIPPDRQDEEPEIISRLKSGERVQHFETKRMTKDKRLLDVSVTISPIKDKHGEIIGVSKIVRDITERKLEEQRKNDFVAMVSHELKTPLTTINSYVQLLLAKAKDDNEAFRINALTRTHVQAKKMTSMIEDFLSVARLEEGKVPLYNAPFNFHKLAEETTADLQFLTSKHNIQLIDCKDVEVNADRDKIGQVLNNLLSNAIKYSPDGGTITVSCEKKGGKATISVTDQGVGIRPEDQVRLFERFYRANNEKLQMVSGFGIGLYLVSEILRFHNSKIELKSEENVGSTFYFTLDIHDGQ
ncbi:PAS domain-containing sensor histidine kinase [Daejeonella lutea]|uniref:histidine kinase n=1 Tax=Daejeonella lutea TaxID=572036 RepID=A0A1T5A669_9SPHI|nr:PAS domain S-box protein [Daejeonella lutea]SKB30430.1 PAS domain S-box-containing protein [Daejeonella lutea]